MERITDITLDNGTTITTTTLARLTIFTTEVFFLASVAEARKAEIQTTKWASEVRAPPSLRPFNLGGSPGWFVSLHLYPRNKTKVGRC